MAILLYSPEASTGADVVSSSEGVVMVVPGVVGVTSPMKQTMVQANQSSLSSSCSTQKTH